MLAPIVRKLHSIGVTANQVTISALVLSFLIGAAFWSADQNKIYYLALPIGLFVRMALNAVDGMIARQYGQQTKLGEVLNELGDVVSDVAIYFPLIKFVPEFEPLVVAFLVLCTINEFAGFMGKVIGKGRRYDGPMGKSDRALVFGVYGLLATFGVEMNSILPWLLMAATVLLVFSTYSRIERSLSA